MKKSGRQTRRRQPSRFQLALRRRSIRKAETFIETYDFPAHIEKRVRHRYPNLADSEWVQVERGLREWFICCAWRGRAVLGMPSRVVDDAWHEFILDSIAYTAFCNVAFGAYLHHAPDEAMTISMGNALGDTIRAWDRSVAGANRESVLWNLDEELGIRNPLGVDGLQLSAARSSGGLGAPGAACIAWAGDGGPSDGGIGGSDGGGCGGGGCGGGGCGGGS